MFLFSVLKPHSSISHDVHSPPTAATVRLPSRETAVPKPSWLRLDNGGFSCGRGRNMNQPIANFTQAGGGGTVLDG